MVDFYKEANIVGLIFVYASNDNFDRIIVGGVEASYWFFWLVILMKPLV